MFRLLRETSDRGELTDATHRITGEILVAADRRFQAIVATVFATAEAAGDISLARTGMTAQRSADLCVAAAKGLMEAEGGAAGQDAFEEGLRDLVRVWTLAVARA